MPEASWFNPAKTVLLTGSGISKDFGGFLATEMWAAILNQPQIAAFPKLRQKLLDELNFEKVYATVLSSEGFTAPERDAFTQAVRSAYASMDAAIFQRKTAASALCSKFIARFNGSRQTRGFIFTLNQDLLLERFFSFGNMQNGLLKIPGLEHAEWFNGRLPDPLTSNYQISLPDNAKLSEIKQKFAKKSVERFAYVKLHGSYGWVGSVVQQAMVMGFEKEGAIAREPLLQWYFELFREVLTQRNAKLVIVGYGFRDKHINDVIVDAVAHDVQIYVISPKQPSEFREMLCPLQGPVEASPDLQKGIKIWNAICGYHCGRVTDFYIDNSSDLTPQGQAFLKQVGLV